MVLFILIVLWLIIGAASFIYEERRYWDLTPDGLIMALSMSMFGPFNLLISRMIQGSVGLDTKEDRNAAHVRSMANYNAISNDISIKYGKHPKPVVIDYDYLSNPAESRIIWRTRNETIRLLQEGHIL